MARRGVFGHDLADDDLVISAGEDFAGLDRLDEFVGMGGGVEHAVPELGGGDDGGSGGGVDGFCVGCDDDDHDGFGFGFGLRFLGSGGNELGLNLIRRSPI